MIVVSDTSAITNLIAIGREMLLSQLFGTVIIPQMVQEELREAHATLPAFIEVREVRDRHAVNEIIETILDPGEAEAIVLAGELGADFLLIDERAGRRVASRRGLKIIGVLGILGRAKSQRLISAVKPEIEALVRVANFRISPDLREEILRDLGEV